MEASSSSFIPTPLAHADNQGEGYPRGPPLHWRETKFNLYDPEVRMGQGAKCQNVGIVELNVQIREFEKPWLFHVFRRFRIPMYSWGGFHEWIKDYLEL
ncbi:hypothetical protein TNCV_1113721 [Trichonephila clavipes]|nr:hypothetical protein TNCV_1113721 [Trichonephila clavipes]